MNYQQKVIRNYQNLFPNLKLREISDQTGIQMTRVFRIFNGAEMKITEYEIFEKIVREEKLDTSYSEIFQNVTSYLNLLSLEKVKRFNKEILTHTQALNYKRLLSSNSNLGIINA